MSVRRSIWPVTALVASLLVLMATVASPAVAGPADSLVIDMSGGKALVCDVHEESGPAAFAVWDLLTGAVADLGPLVPAGFEGGSVDAERVAYSLPGQPDVYVLYLGSYTERLQRRLNAEPAVIREGKLVWREEGGLVLYDLETREETWLVEAGSGVVGFRFDGSRVIYRCEGGGADGLRVVTLDGLTTVNLPDTAEADTYAIGGPYAVWQVGTNDSAQLSILDLRSNSLTLIDCPDIVDLAASDGRVVWCTSDYVFAYNCVAGKLQKGAASWGELRAILASGDYYAFNMISYSGRDWRYGVGLLPFFLDVDYDLSYFSAIQEMAEPGIIGGYPVAGGREFRPNNPVLRAQFAKMIVGSLGLPLADEGSEIPFRDLGPDTADDPYPHQYVATAFRAGIIKGKTTTRFAPWEKVTRSQVVTMVVRATTKLYPHALTNPPTAYSNSWGISYDREQGPLARLAAYNGLLAGLPLSGAARDPWGAMPRGEVAQVLTNAMKLTVLQVTGAVRGPAGEPIEGVAVSMCEPMGQVLKAATSDSSGRFTVSLTLGDLRAGMFTAMSDDGKINLILRTGNDKGYVDVYYPDTPVLFCRPFDISYYFDGSAGGIEANISFATGYQIAGKVTTSTGEPIAGAIVYASASARVAAAEGVTGADGSYVIGGLPRADYTVRAQYGPITVFYEANISVTGDTNGIDIVLDP